MSLCCSGDSEGRTRKKSRRLLGAFGHEVLDFFGFESDVMDQCAAEIGVPSSDGWKRAILPLAIQLGTVDSKARVSTTTRSWNFGSRTSAEACIGWPPSSS